MTVKELIDCLKQMPEDEGVCCIWDGAIRSEIELIWVSKAGRVVVSDFDEVVYSDDDRPVNAPTGAENRFWYTPAKDFKGERILR